ncbi:MAG: hydrogenase 4 subunit F [Candidatus Omnitrophica bacterium]|nr:hydrogenase 4 subunit F [Candidatus Omnitrophota bacterium]
MNILFILIIPFILVILPSLVKKPKTLGILNAIGYLFVLLCSLLLVLKPGLSVSPFKFFYIDELSVFFIFTISIVTFAAALFSIDYIGRDVASFLISRNKARAYYTFFNIFSLSMFFVPMVRNLALVWVAIEMTTLASAFLVGFYNTKSSIEAAWKYIMVCSVGIIFALFGTIIFYYASSSVGVKNLNWVDMVSASQGMDKNLVKIAFLFILVGYGTKAGLAPMHTWLPDAHSQAISPVSALLSGVLLKTAIYAILRFSIITNKCAGGNFSSKLFIIFALISLGVSAGFIIIQKQMKRLLAYSSIEHVGVIFLGFGFGGAIGLYGALFHILNHAVTKSLMFFGAANVIKKYKKDNMNMIRGVIGSMPFTGTMFILGMFALTGMPPFSIFFSELLILMAGLGRGLYLASGLYLFFIALIFGGILFHFSNVLFGSKPDDMEVTKEVVSAKIVFIFLFILMVVLGLAMPGFLNKIIVSSAAILEGA